MARAAAAAGRGARRPRAISKSEKDLAAICRRRATITLLRIELSTSCASGDVDDRLSRAVGGWVPAYHALLRRAMPVARRRMPIVRRAEVTQATGEDWTTSLSPCRRPGRPAEPRAGSRSRPGHLRCRPRDRLAIGKMTRWRRLRAGASAARRRRERCARRGQAGAASPRRPPISATSAPNIAVPGPVSLASGVGARGLPHRDRTEVEPALEVRAVPACRPPPISRPFHRAGRRLPSSPAGSSLFRDGAFVGRGRRRFTNAGARLDLGFGVDDRVKVTRIAIDREPSRPGS